jgi:hypothetical protein
MINVSNPRCITLWLLFQHVLENLYVTRDLLPRTWLPGVPLNRVRYELVATAKLSIQHVLASAHGRPSY